MWMLILQKLIYGPSILALLYLVSTALILLVINIKNKNLQHYLSNIYQDRKNTALLKYWIILDDEKKLHKEEVKKYYKKVNVVMYIFILLFIFILLLNEITVTQLFATVGIIVVYIIILFCLFQSVLYKFPIAITLLVPFISYFIVSALHDSNKIENIILLKALFVLFAAIFYGFICFVAEPYIIRNLHKNQLFINGLPNIILLVITFLMNTIENPKLNFTSDSNFSKLPNEIQNILSNKEFVNIISDIIYQSQTTQFTSEITTYILMISITIFTFSAALNIKMKYDNNKAKRLLSSVRRNILKQQKFCYSDFQKISYYGGSYYEDQLFCIPGVYKFIYEIEMNKAESENTSK